MEKIILASNNKNKIKEIGEMLPHMQVLSLNDIGLIDDIVEDGNTFVDNALIKARATYAFLKDKKMSAWILADDSGLCVNALGGEPGVYSARYAGDHNDKANRAKLLKSLHGKTDRSAYFMCAMALISPSGKECTFEVKTEGKILQEEQGNNGFGYDCVFYSNDIGKCFGMCTPDEKNAVSHRGRALSQVVNFLHNKKSFH